MPQMKLGWIAINGPAQAVAEARHRLELIADTYLSVGTPVQMALPQLFRVGETIERELNERLRTNLSSAIRVLRDGPVQPLRCEGGWSAILRLPATQSEESWTLGLLQQCGVLTQPGFFFDMASEPYIVVSLITPPEQFQEGVARIHDFALRQ
jgi:aspartate/methionine/tyrosine aminotransferase